MREIKVVGGKVKKVLILEKGRGDAASLSKKERMSIERWAEQKAGVSLSRWVNKAQWDAAEAEEEAFQRELAQQRAKVEAEQASNAAKYAAFNEKHRAEVRAFEKAMKGLKTPLPAWAGVGVKAIIARVHHEDATLIGEIQAWSTKHPNIRLVVEKYGYQGEGEGGDIGYHGASGIGSRM